MLAYDALMDQARSDLPPTPPAPTPRKPAPPKQSVEGSVKDTIESILVAFMLAFIFRAFVVEAFVIPTGSMAPTLLGAHMRFRCPDCGYRYDANFSGRQSGTDDIDIPATAGSNRSFALFCPNCGYRLPRDNAADPDNDAIDAPVRYGDRILVLKYLYMFQEPSRWDVVVFKSPVEPATFDYQQNYIKRLVGLPGDSVAVLDGDVYIGKGESIETFKIQTKPRRVQEALWRIVSDSDYLPRGLSRDIVGPGDRKEGSDQDWQQPWKQPANQSGWTVPDLKTARTFSYANPNGAASIIFDAAANPRKYALTEWLAYDVTDGQTGDAYNTTPQPPAANVSDIKLDFFYQRHSGDGALTAQVTKRGVRFEAVITQSDAKLLMEGKLIGQSMSLPRSAAPLHVELINVDYRVALRINDVEVATTTPEQYAPDISKLIHEFQSNTNAPKPTIQITADAQTCEISHLSLWRDIYYRNNNGGNPLRWANPSQVMELGKDEFFVLGDNSQVSLDARYWDQPIKLPHENLEVEDGRVPRRFMLGKAFFVYWPAGYKPIDAPNVPALAPDFGDMRFIH